ncbi:MAG: dolichol-phosphate mannosyltransferase [Rhodospirillales bacterium RIFCSPLOWO2_12_FULL_58_28]|nr:MAG: dolichol-phosphate mannosyltransferase [Rhodospirillales bacterium RIFCSPLOWO2_02_FULL_58_16]OHC79775.1 MAG: dolichol-phosphate mannosyltransferase [Rhodospirillales bacterium RIFCSPLOWO2_12_FULL_58_28]
MTDLSIVLPAYNERENIVALVERLLQVMDGVVKGLEIIVIDDNSPDGTAEAVRRVFSGDHRVQVVVRTENRGLANSIRVGIEKSAGEVVVVMDTDFNHPPECVPILYDFTRHADLVIGSRFTFGGGTSSSRLRYYLSYCYNLFMRLVLGTRIDDNLGGLFSIKREALEKLDFDKIFWGYGDYFFRLLLLSQRLGLRHVQIPVMYGNRLGGEPKTRFLNIFAKYTMEVFRIIYLRATGRW